MNVKRHIRLTWLFAILTMVLFTSMFLFIETISPDDLIATMLFGLYIIGIFAVGIASLVFLITIRSRLRSKQKNKFLFLLAVSGLLLLILEYLVPLNDYIAFIYYDTILFGLVGIFVLSSIYALTCYMHFFDNIFLGLFAGIILGLILNRFGMELAGFIVGFCLFLSFYGLLFLAITHSIKSKENRHFRRLISAFCYVNCFIFLLLFIKFSSEQPAFTKPIDTIGVIIFILASIALFISMPLSNFIEWLKSQREIFYKVVLLPFLFFLIVFSLRFLLSDSTYRKIFFIEFSKTEKVHFGMEEYESEID